MSEYVSDGKNVWQGEHIIAVAETPDAAMRIAVVLNACRDISTLALSAGFIHEIINKGTALSEYALELHEMHDCDIKDDGECRNCRLTGEFTRALCLLATGHTL